MSEQTVKVGDDVVRGGEGQLMTVASITGDTATCRWSDGAADHETDVPVAELVVHPELPPVGGA